jgi:hypothetical protein
VLWNQFGIRPMDVEQLTLTEVVAVEAALAQWEREKR